MKSHHVDLLNEAIAPALTRLALPIMATSLVQMLYNLTDMAWIGRLGAGAVTAVGSAGMYTWFSQGFAILARTGGQVKTAIVLVREKMTVRRSMREVRCSWGFCLPCCMGWFRSLEPVG